MIHPNRRQLLGASLGLFAAPALIRNASAASHLRVPVAIQNFLYTPANLEIGAGDYVVFTNNDGAPHTATARDGTFDTGFLNRGQSSEIRMTETGTFEYFCIIHPDMVASITVT